MYSSITVIVLQCTSLVYIKWDITIGSLMDNSRSIAYCLFFTIYIVHFIEL